MSCFNIPGDMALSADETDCVFVEGLISVLQQVRAGAQVFAGRWVYDAKKGLAYIEQVFEKNPDLRIVKLMFYEFFLSIPGVNAVTSTDLRVDNATRTLYVYFEVDTDFGPLAEKIALVFGA